MRPSFLGDNLAIGGLGVTVLGHTMTLIEGLAVVGGLGVVLMSGAMWAFSRQA